MGYGDYIHWTAIIRDLYNFINSIKNNQDKIQKIKSLCDKNSEWGIYKYKQKNENSEFKFLITLNWKQNNNNFDINRNHQAKEVFSNNKFIILNDDYPNVIYFKIVSNGYWENVKYISNIPTATKIIDDIHVINYYLSKMNISNNDLKNFKLNGYIKFTKDEINKVKKFLPKNDFLLINFQGKVESRSYNKDKMQKIVNYLKDKIEIVQIIPDQFQNVKFKNLDNVTIIKNKLTFRETLCFAKNAKYAILAHGGLSIGIGCFKIPTICLYSNLFNPNMTNYKWEIPHLFCDHKKFCYDIYCKKCLELKEKSDEKEIINIIKNKFNL